MTKASKLHRSVGITFDPEENMTEEQHKSDVEIHAIMRKYKETGVVNHVNKYQGSYMDMISAPDFTEAQRQIAEAKSMFESVPSHIRDDFGNDPARFLDFMQNPANRDQIAEYGFDTQHLGEHPDYPAPPESPREMALAPEETPNNADEE